MGKRFFIGWLGAVMVMPAFALFNPYTYLNYLENIKTAIHTAEQVKQQLQLLRFAAQNSGHVSGYQWRTTLNLLQAMDQVSRQGQALSYAAANRDVEFRQDYPNYAQSPYADTDYAHAYQQWDTITLATVHNALAASGLASQQLTGEQDYLAQLRQQGQSAQGRLQVLQVSSELAAENVNQLQSLQRLMMTQANAENAYMAYRVSKDSYAEANLAQITQKASSRFPSYHNNAHFSVLPTH